MQRSTSGVFKPTAFNNASFDNVTAVPSGAVEGGNMVLLSTQTASGDASISFTTGIDSTYKEYMFIFNNIHPSTDDQNFTFNLSADSGSNYNVTKTTTYFRSIHNEGDSFTSLSYDTSRDIAQGTGFQSLSSGVQSSSDGSVSGYLHLFDPSNTTFVKHYISVVNAMITTAYSMNDYSAGYGNTTSAIDAIQFKFASGNIDDGTIQMFGIL